jgi:hypothetical protein
MGKPFDTNKRFYNLIGKTVWDKETVWLLNRKAVRDIQMVSLLERKTVWDIETVLLLNGKTVPYRCNLGVIKYLYSINV